MEEFKKDIDVLERVSELPDDLRKALFARETTETIKTIGKRHEINIGELADETGHVMLGITPASAYVDNLSIRVGVNKVQARSIAAEINREVFSSVRESLRDIHGHEVWEMAEIDWNTIHFGQSGPNPDTLTRNSHYETYVGALRSYILSGRKSAAQETEAKKEWGEGLEEAKRALDSQLARASAERESALNRVNVEYNEAKEKADKLHNEAADLLKAGREYLQTVSELLREPDLAKWKPPQLRFSPAPDEVPEDALRTAKSRASMTLSSFAPLVSQLSSLRKRQAIVRGLVIFLVIVLAGATVSGLAGLIYIQLQPCGELHVRLYNPLCGHTGYVSNWAFSLDGRRLASAGADQTIRLWDVISRREIVTLKVGSDRVRSVAFSPNGRLLASGSSSIKLWDLVSGREIATLGTHRDSVYSLAFSRNGRLLASGGDDKDVRLWDAVSRRELATFSGHQGIVRSLAFDPKGRLLASGSWDKTIKLWDVLTHKELATLSGNQGSVSAVVFSPKARLLASGSSHYLIELWDTISFREVGQLRGHKRGVIGLAFSPDGRLLASIGQDETIKVWDIASQREIMSLGKVTSTVVTFSSDGWLFGSGSREKAVYIERWKVQ